jgi:CheY-like chemotaxis protein
MVRIDFNRLRFLVIDDNAHMRRILRTLLHGFGALTSMRPRMVQPGLKPLRTTLRGRIEIGFDFRGGEQIFKADASRLRRLADRPGHLWCRAGSSRMNGHRVAPCEDLVLWVMTRTQTFPGQPAEHGGIMVNEW